MQWQLTVYSSMYYLTGMVALVTAWINWRRRDQAGITWLALAMLFVAIWSAANGLEMGEVGGHCSFRIRSYA